MILYGTVVDSVLVILGSLVGVIFHKGLPEKLKRIIFQTLGIAVLVLGIQMTLKAEDFLIVIFSAIIGGILGEVAAIDLLFERLAEFLKRKIKSKNEKFTDGMVSGFLMFCVGSMTILGAINEGIKGDSSLLVTKAVLDGFIALVLAATYGIGVAFAAIPLIIYEGSLTLLAASLQGVLSNCMIDQLTSVGGIMIIAISFNLLDIKKVTVINMLPSLIVVVVLTLLFDK